MQVIFTFDGNKFLLNISGAQLEVLQTLLGNMTAFATDYVGDGHVSYEKDTPDYTLELPTKLLRLTTKADAEAMKEACRLANIKTACETFFDSPSVEKAPDLFKQLYYNDVLNYEEYDPEKHIDFVIHEASSDYPGPEACVTVTRKDGKSLRRAPKETEFSAELHIYRDRLEFS